MSDDLEGEVADSSLTSSAVRVIVVLAVAVGLLVGTVGAWWMAAERDPFEPMSIEQGESRYAPVGDLEVIESQPAVLELTWSPTSTLRGGSISGRVTAVPAVPASLEAGSLVIEVDGVERFALAGSRPLWRELADGVSGPDVVAVYELLVLLGYAQGTPGDTVDSRFMEAVRSFETDVGWAASGVFRPDYTVWLPTEPFEVDRYDVAVGELLGPETVLTASNSRVIDAQVAGLGPATPVTVPEPYQFEVLSGPTLAVSDGRIIDDDLGRLTEAAYDLAPESGLPRRLDGVARATVPAQAQTVPASAIIIGGDGAQCVVVDGGRIVAVIVTGGQSGVSEIDPVLQLDAMVLVNPTAAETERCSLS